MNWIKIVYKSMQLGWKYYLIFSILIDVYMLNCDHCAIQTQDIQSMNAHSTVTLTQFKRRTSSVI